MAQIVVTLNVELDGVSVFGRGPLVRRFEADESVRFCYEKDADNGSTYTAIPGLASLVASAGLLYVQPKEVAINLRLNGQTDQGIPLAAGGILLLLDSTITATSVNNPEATDSTLIDVVASGT